MTFSVYSPVRGRVSGEIYPPTAPAEVLPARFERSYVGAPELEGRIRRAIASYAVRTWVFWQSSIYVGVLGVIVGIAGLHDYLWLIPFFALVIVIMAVSTPLSELWDVRKVAKTYSNPYFTYRASFSADSIVWQTPAGSFEVQWDSMNRRYGREGVTVVALKNTRAIVVLPDELITAGAETRLNQVYPSGYTLSLSKSQVSRMAADLDEHVQQFRHRPLGAARPEMLTLIVTVVSVASSQEPFTSKKKNPTSDKTNAQRNC